MPWLSGEEPREGDLGGGCTSHARPVESPLSSGADGTYTAWWPKRRASRAFRRTFRAAPPTRMMPSISSVSLLLPLPPLPPPLLVLLLVLVLLVLLLLLSAPRSWWARCRIVRFMQSPGTARRDPGDKPRQELALAFRGISPRGRRSMRCITASSKPFCTEAARSASRCSMRWASVPRCCAQGPA